MSRKTQVMEEMYNEMMIRRAALSKSGGAKYQYDGCDRFSILYYNQLRDAAFAKAKIPPFGDGSVPYVLAVEPERIDPVKPVGSPLTNGQWVSQCKMKFTKRWEDWWRKSASLDREYLEACGCILELLGPDPMAQVQQYTTTLDGMLRFTQMSTVIRSRYYPTSNLEVEIMLEWISKSSDEYGIKVWFALWQEALDLLSVVQPTAIPTNQQMLRYLETGMTNQMLKVFYSSVKELRVPDIGVGAAAGALRAKTWREIKEELLLYLERNPEIEANVHRSVKSSSVMVMARTTSNFNVKASGMACFNCGAHGHFARECQALKCGKCNKTWTSTNIPDFHRSNQRDKCPVWIAEGGGKRKPSTFGKGTSSVQDSVPITKKAYKAHYQEGRSSGMEEAIKALESGKTVAELKVLMAKKKSP